MSHREARSGTYHRCTVDQCEPATAVNGNDYVRLRLNPGGYANSWDEALFARLHEAKKSGKPVMLEIVESENPKNPDRPFTEVIGIEHPGQLGLFGQAAGDEVVADE